MDRCMIDGFMDRWRVLNEEKMFVINWLYNCYNYGFHILMGRLLWFFCPTLFKNEEQGNVNLEVKECITTDGGSQWREIQRVCKMTNDKYVNLPNWGQMKSTRIFT